MHSFATTQAYAIAYFGPIILQTDLGFSVGITQLLSVPHAVFGGIVMVVEGLLSDRYRWRSPTIAFNALCSILGLALLGWTGVPGVQYLGLFLTHAGCQSNIPAVLAWQASNIRGQWKRVFCSASIITFGGLGGIVGSLSFRTQDAPRYLPGIWTSIA
jgi:MFS family permease